jgi:hypothetical protein
MFVLSPRKIISSEETYGQNKRHILFLSAIVGWVSFTVEVSALSNENELYIFRILWGIKNL